jgi:hypothetical protein
MKLNLKERAYMRLVRNMKQSNATPQLTLSKDLVLQKNKTLLALRFQMKKHFHLNTSISHLKKDIRNIEESHKKMLKLKNLMNKKSSRRLNLVLVLLEEPAGHLYKQISNKNDQNNRRLCHQKKTKILKKDKPAIVWLYMDLQNLIKLNENTVEEVKNVIESTTLMDVILIFPSVNPRKGSQPQRLLKPPMIDIS